MTKTVERAQKKIEDNNFGIRKNLMDYDLVNNEQREEIYAQRNGILNSENISEVIEKMIHIESEENDTRELDAYRKLNREETYSMQKDIILAVLDREWMQHIDNLEQLRQSIGLQSYAQKDPVIAYRNESYEIFGQMIQRIREDSIRLVMEMLRKTS